MASSADLDPLFRPLETGRVSGQIVERIRDAIRRGELGVGDRLPPERELTALLGVSRVTVRDALRTLEARGLIEIRVGAHGGAFVTAPGAAQVAEGLTDMITLADLTDEEVIEARRVFELGMIPHICERADADDIAALTELCDEAEAATAEGRFDVQLSADFHARLAHASHNKAIQLVTGVLQEPLRASLEHARQRDPAMGARGVEEHREIVAAVEAGDAEHATRVMREHLDRTAQRLGKPLPEASSATAD